MNIEGTSGNEAAQGEEKMGEETIDTTMIPTIEPEEPKKSGKRVWVLILAAVVVVAVASAEFLIVRNKQHEAALADCQKQEKAYSLAKTDFTEAHEAAADVAKVTAKQVADDTVLTAFADSYDAPLPKIGACSADLSTDELKSTSEKDATAIKAVEAMTTAIAADAQQVTDSVEAKKLADAQTALKAGISAAQKTYDDSKGKVADEKTRENLKKQLDASNALLKNTGAAPDEITNAKSDLDAAAKKVTDSVSAKAKADAEKAAAAAQAAQAQKSTGGYSGSTYSNGSGYSTAKSYSGSTKSYGTGSTTKKSTGTTNGKKSSGQTSEKSSGASSSGGFDLGIDTTYACKPGKFCPIG